MPMRVTCINGHRLRSYLAVGQRDALMLTCDRARLRRIAAVCSRWRSQHRKKQLREDLSTFHRVFNELNRFRWGAEFRISILMQNTTILAPKPDKAYW